MVGEFVLRSFKIVTILMVLGQSYNNFSSLGVNVKQQFGKYETYLKGNY